MKFKKLTQCSTEKDSAKLLKLAEDHMFKVKGSYSGCCQCDAKCKKYCGEQEGSAGTMYEGNLEIYEDVDWVLLQPIIVLKKSGYTEI